MADQSEDESAKKAPLRFVTSNARFQHVFVVGRIWKSLPEDRDPSAVLEGLTLTKAFLTEGDANDEAKRLSALNGEDWTYFVSVARLVPGPGDEGTNPTG